MGTSDRGAGSAASLRNAIARFVEQELQPAIREDGGNIELVGVTGTAIQLRMSGMCATCPSRCRTVRHCVEPRLRSRFGARWSVSVTFQKPYFA